MDRIAKCEWLGLDVDSEETSLASKEGIYSNVYTAPADQIPEPDNSFDFVFSNSVFEHKYIDIIDLRCAYLRYWSHDTWSEHLQAANMKIIISEPYLNQAQVQCWETLSRFTAGLFFTLFGKQRQPIEIQRKLGMRRHNLRLPLSIGVNNENATELHGCCRNDQLIVQVLL